MKIGRFLVGLLASLLLAAPACAHHIETAESTVVIVRAHIHVHYFTVEEMQNFLHVKRTQSMYSNLVLLPKMTTTHMVIDYAHTGTGKNKGKVSNQDVISYVPPPSDEDYLQQPICSGFVVSAAGQNQTVVTARHCMDPETIFFGVIPIAQITLDPTSVIYFGGDNGAVINIIKGKDADLGLLQTVSLRPHTDALKIDPRPLVRGDDLIVLGMPGGIPFYLSDATSATGPDETLPDPSGNFGGLEQLACPSCFGGDSGAPVLDSDGEVRGVVDAGSDQPAWLGIVPSYRVVQLIQNEQ